MRGLAELKGGVRRLGSGLVNKPRHFLSALFTKVRGSGILRSSPVAPLSKIRRAN